MLRRWFRGMLARVILVLERWVGWKRANVWRQRFRIQTLPKLCCRDEKNLAVIEVTPPDKVTKRCAVCNCRHFEVTVDPGVFGLTGGGEAKAPLR